MVKKETVLTPEMKQAAPKGHPLLPLLFLGSKRCLHNEVGTCI